MLPRQRIVGIDVCRSMAIIAAMSSHAFVASGAFEHNHSAGMIWFRFFTQLSPPIFIGLFGSMLYIAYRPKFASGQTLAGVQQLLSRSAQCYILYVICVAARVFEGSFSIGYGLRCALLIGVTPFVDILKFYALMLAAAPIIIAVSTRYRFGLAILLGVAVIPHLAHPLWAHLEPLPRVFGRDYLSFPASFLYGGAAGAGGPSLLHGLYLVVYGMWLGRTASALLSGDGAGRNKARHALFIGTVLSALISASLWDWQAPYETVRAISDMSLRNLNHPIYYALGTCAMTVAAWAALEFYDVQRKSFGRPLTFIGASSLFTFSFGNIILILAPRVTTEPLGSLVYGLALLAIVIGMSWTFRWALERGAQEKESGKCGVAARFASFQGKIVARIHETVLWPSRVYAKMLQSLLRNTLPSRVGASTR